MTNFAKMQHDKKGKFCILFLCQFAKIPKTTMRLWNFHDFATLRLCDDYGKQEEKQGDPERSPNFMGFSDRK